MLILSLLLMAAAIAVYVLLPSVLLHMRVPVPVFALLLGALVAAAVSRRRGPARNATLSLAGLLTGAVVVFTFGMTGFDGAGIGVVPGDRFPEIVLPTSTGEPFSSAELIGEKAALYVFYRGDW